MSTASTSTGTSSGAATCNSGPLERILVWDLPTRVFHWSLAASFAIAWLTAESERLRNVHLVAGYSLLVLIAFRLVWGLAGTRYARFAAFVRGPAAVMRYLRSLGGRRPEHHVGHNPAGALAIIALLVLGTMAGLSGWATYNDTIGGEWAEDLHEGVANGMLAVVLLHLAGVVVSSVLHRENLVRAMITGRKAGDAADGIRTPHRLAGWLLAGLLAALWSVGLGDGPARLPGMELAPTAGATDQTRTGESREYREHRDAGERGEQHH